MSKFAPKFVIDYSMKRIFHVFCGLFTAVLMLTSCLSSDDNSTTLYSDMAIKSFSLGNLNRYVHTTTSAGADSVYKQTYSASSYKMNIDQVNHKICNADSLPTGTDAAHVICSATTVNNGVIYVKSLISDTLFYFSSGSDSIDFTQPRIFRVYATDGSGSRDYTVSLSVRNQEKGIFQWTSADKAGFPTAEDSVERRAAEQAGLEYLGMSKYECYAIDPATRLLMESEDHGLQWKADQLDTDISLLPTAGFSFASWLLDYKTDYALLVGYRNETDKAMTVWRKLVDDDGNGRWAYMPLDETNPYYLPFNKQVQLVKFADGVLAFCGDKTIYQSRDQGITWKKTSAYKFPTDFTGTTFKVAFDGYEELWLMDENSGQTWSGKLTE